MWQLFESALKQNFWFGFSFFFVNDVISRVGIWPFGRRLPDPGPKPLDGSILLKFLLERVIISNQKHFSTMLV